MHSCIVFISKKKHEITVIEPLYEIRSHAIMAYTAIVMRVYENRNPVMEKEFPAWPCDFDSIDTILAPELLVDVDPTVIYLII